MTSHTQRSPASRVDSLFEDFDDQQVFDRIRNEAASEKCANFVLEFGPNRARVAQNLQAQDFNDLLQSDARSLECPIRWINIWDTSEQQGAVDAIGTTYQFSPRLLSLMKYATDMAELAKVKGAKREETLKMRLAREAEDYGDLEKGLTRDSDSMPSRSNMLLAGEDIELYAMLKDTVNYSSIDQTNKAICIGAHWLHRLPEASTSDFKKSRKSEFSIMPPKHWMWITMCNDSTVLSFHDRPNAEEAPTGMSHTAASKWIKENIRNMRSNTLNVLLQQSKQGFDLFKVDPLSQNLIRVALANRFNRRVPQQPEGRITSGADYHQQQMQSLGAEGASNLFYYLFEDYAAAQPLKSADKILEELTPIVLESDRRSMQRKTGGIIPQLHHLSKDLRELKHLFENYRNLIDKIMEKTKPERPAGATMSRSFSNFSDIAASGFTGIADGATFDMEEDRPVNLSKTSRDRFDRLGDRLQWLMLNTIQGHLEEIAALSDTYFNLTQQKDSRATAKLNSSATLLAKLSVFFLPISFMTSYFSVQIEDLYIYWTAEDYWYAFAGIATLSFLCLFFFGRLLMFVVDTLDNSANRSLTWCRDSGRYVAARGKNAMRATGLLRRRRRGTSSNDNTQDRADHEEEKEDVVVTGSREQADLAVPLATYPRRQGRPL